MVAFVTLVSATNAARIRRTGIVGEHAICIGALRVRRFTFNPARPNVVDARIANNFVAILNDLLVATDGAD